METSILQVSKNMNQTEDQQLKLIEGKFTKFEALDILNNIVDVKINFHKLQRLSKTEGNINNNCKYDNSRIKELIEGKEITKAFLKSLENNACNIKISSTIHISIEE